MKVLAVAIVASVLSPVQSPAQETMWHAEGHDVLLVAPGARDVHYTHGARDLLTYTVDVEYPATDVVAVICGDLQRKGWRAVAGCSGNDWHKSGSRTMPYTWLPSWTDNNGDYVNYHLDYDDLSERGHTPRMLRVQAYFVTVPQTPPQNRADLEVEAPPSGAPLPVRLVLTGLSAFFLIALPRILIVPRVRQAIFYDGRHAWLTWLNLFLSLPVAAALLGVAVFVVSGVFGKVAVNFAVVLALAAVITLMLLAKVGYVLCAGPLLLAGGLYLSTGIPARVKLAHIVLSLITFVFYIICANSSPGPLMQF